jgi:hypothetical protein
MTTIEQTQRERTEMAAWAGAAGLFGGLFTALAAGLRGLGQLRVGADVIARPQIVSGVTSEIFARAVSEGSNSAMDWLYYAAQLEAGDERRYCIGKALQIDPSAPVVQAEARRLR